MKYRLLTESDFEGPSYEGLDDDDEFEDEDEDYDNPNLCGSIILDRSHIEQWYENGSYVDYVIVDNHTFHISSIFNREFNKYLNMFLDDLHSKYADAFSDMLDNPDFGDVLTGIRDADKDSVFRAIEDLLG